jgi:hypothetical protein
MKILSLETFTQKLGVEVYPITIMKFLLNKGKILSYFRKAADPEYTIRYTYKIDHDDCEQCQRKADDGILCRQHTSIDRVLSADTVLLDLDTHTYFFKNEIYKIVNDRMVIVYCPHPKLISGKMTDQKVRRINPITVDDPGIFLNHKTERTMLSTDLLDQHTSCWFNDEYTIVTIPEDGNKSNFCLVLNH